MTPVPFFEAVLAAIKAPNTKANIAFLSGWAKREGTAAANNPLATTLKAPGSVPLPGNSAGVQQYPTAAAGAVATAETLQNYPSIMSALQSGNPRFTIGVGNDLLKWSGGGYSSFTPAAGYPVAGTGLGVVDTGVNAALSLATGLTNPGSIVANVENWLATEGKLALAYLVLVAVAGALFVTGLKGLGAPLPKIPKTVPVPVPV